MKYVTSVRDNITFRLTITADLRPQIRSPHTSLHVHCSRHRHLLTLLTQALVGGRTERHSVICHCWRADSQR